MMNLALDERNMREEVGKCVWCYCGGESKLVRSELEWLWLYI